MIILALVIAIIVSYFYYKKNVPTINKQQKIFLVILRTIAISIILILLLSPILYFSQKVINKDNVIILHDVSWSMEQKINGNTKNSILNKKIIKLKKHLQKLNYKLTDYDFADGLKGGKGNTYLSSSLKELLSDMSGKEISSIFLVSDGWFHDKTLNVINEVNTPINTFETPQTNTTPDLEILSIKTNQEGFRKDIIPIKVDLQASEYKGSAKVKLFINNKLSSQKKLHFRKKAFKQLDFENEFTKSGLNIIKIVISADSLDEIFRENNQAETAIMIKKQHSKALVITDVYNWDEKYIMTALKRDDKWDTRLLLQWNRRYYLGNKKVDIHKEFKDVELLVIVNYGKLVFDNTQIKLLENYLKNGGGLLFIGSPLKNIKEMLPIEGNYFASKIKSTFHLTRESKKYRSMDFEREIKNIPPLSYTFVNPKVQAQILAEFDNETNSPAILFSKYQKGKILYLSFRNIWKWQMRSDEEGLFNFINDSADWLSNSDTKRFFARTDKNAYLTGEPIRFTLQAYDEKLMPLIDLDAKIIISKAKKVLKEDYLIRADQDFIYELDNSISGSYSYKIISEKYKKETTGQYIVTNQSPENHDLGFNNSILSYIAEQTGGTFINEKSDLKKIITEGKVKYSELRHEIPLYKKWYLIFFFILSFSLELFFRKRWGLL